MKQPRQLDPEDPNVRRAVFGKQVEDFLASDIGKYLAEKASDEALKLTLELKECDPNDSKKVAALQNAIKRVESIADWLADAIVEGEQAMRTIEGQDGQEGV